MSRVGKKHIEVPSDLQVTISQKTVTVTSKGKSRSITVSSDIDVQFTDNKLVLSKIQDTKQAGIHWGLYRNLLNNVVVGFTKGYTIELELVGTGYRAFVDTKNRILTLNLGYSHPIGIEYPEDITVVAPKQTEITISGIDRKLVGEMAAKIQSYRKPEPYKGKGVLKKGQAVFRKEGKKK